MTVFLYRDTASLWMVLLGTSVEGSVFAESLQGGPALAKGVQSIQIQGQALMLIVDRGLS